jgi:hypothetical protein
MGANDDILGDEGGGTPAQPANPSPGAAAAADPALVSKAVQAELAKFSGQFDGKLNEMGKAIGQYVNQAVQGAQQRVSQGTGSSDDQDLAQKLINDPKGTVESIIDERMRQQLVPYLSNKIESDWEDNLDRQRTTVDARWGAGAFDEFIKDEVIDTAKTTPNQSAKGDKRFVGVLVQQVVGRPEVFEKLIAHKLAADKKQADEGTDDVTDTGVLGPGRRRPKNESTIGDEERAFMQEVAQRTGDDIDLKKLDEVGKVRRKHGFLDSQVMPGVKNKLPVKGTRHRNSAAAS